MTRRRYGGSERSSRALHLPTSVGQPADTSAAAGTAQIAGRYQYTVHIVLVTVRACERCPMLGTQGCPRLPKAAQGCPMLLPSGRTMR